MVPVVLPEVLLLVVPAVVPLVVPEVDPAVELLVVPEVEPAVVPEVVVVVVEEGAGSLSLSLQELKVVNATSAAQANRVIFFIKRLGM